MKGELKLDHVFKKGKHAGKSVRETIDQDITYVKWCHKHLDGFKLDAEAFRYLVEKNKSGPELPGYRKRVNNPRKW